MLSDGQDYGYTGFSLDNLLTTGPGPVDGTTRPVAEACGHGLFEGSQTEQFLALGQSLINTWADITFCPNRWLGMIGIRIEKRAMSHVQPEIYRR